MAEVIDDGFGSEWEKCKRRDCDLQVVRPGKVQCSGDDDEIGCPQGLGGLVDGLYAEIERLRAAGDALHDAYQQHGTAGWSKTISQAKAFRAWEEARRG